MNRKEAAIVTVILAAFCAVTAGAFEYGDPLAAGLLFGALFFPSFLVVFVVDVVLSGASKAGRRAELLEEAGRLRARLVEIDRDLARIDTELGAVRET